MRVVLEGEYSDEITVDSGVPQGTVLGPILFLCHINSVISSVRLFADDCLLYREINKDNYHTTLKNDLKTSRNGHQTGECVSMPNSVTF
jgi:hypothetical protein